MQRSCFRKPHRLAGWLLVHGLASDVPVTLGRRRTRYDRFFRATAQSAQFFLSSANASGPLPTPINYGLVSDRPVVGKWR